MNSTVEHLNEIIKTCDNAPHGITTDGKINVEAVKSCELALEDCLALATEAKHEIEEMANRHRDDEGLWCDPASAPEAHIQSALKVWVYGNKRYCGGCHHEWVGGPVNEDENCPACCPPNSNI